jgi:hypothetical protein
VGGDAFLFPASARLEQRAAAVEHASVDGYVFVHYVFGPATQARKSTRR